MKKLIYILVFIFFGSNVFAANNSEFVVAKVNNKVITNSELLDRYKFVLFISDIKIKTESDRKILLSQILDKMIDEELIRQDAVAMRLEAAAEEVREMIDVIAAQKKKNATQFKLSITSHGLSFDNYLAQIESEILWSKIISEVLRSKVKITEVELQEFFEQHKYNTSVKQFHIAEIFIPQSPNALQLTNKLLEELKQGADFKNIVRQFSRGTNIESDGEIGWVSQRDIDAKIYASLLKVAKGGYSDPIFLSEGYHIFKIIDIKSETSIPEQDMKAAKNYIFSRKLQSLAKGYLMNLRKKSFVETSQL